MYRGYKIEAEMADGKWRCIVTPSRPDLPILWRFAFFYSAKAEAIADARRRVDELLAL